MLEESKVVASGLYSQLTLEILGGRKKSYLGSNNYAVLEVLFIIVAFSRLKEVLEFVRIWNPRHSLSIQQEPPGGLYVEVLTASKTRTGPTQSNARFPKRRRNGFEGIRLSRELLFGKQLAIASSYACICVPPILHVFP